jgi:ATP-dependent protease ClpP protease subunit
VAEDKNYRPNPARSIFIAGAIDLELVRKLTPEILRLREEGTGPITVYIDSPGGIVFCANTLIDLLRSRNQNGTGCSIITVATGMAASAAADILAAGNYALSYPGASIHFHGTRQRAEDEITMESAHSAASYLRERNEQRALSQARNCIFRIVFLMITGRNEYEKGDDTATTEIERFSRYLLSKTSFNADRVIKTAARRFRDALGILNVVLPHLGKTPPKSGAETELKLLQLLLKYETKKNRKTAGWSFTDGGLQSVVEDFHLFNDFVYGKHSEFLDPLCESWGVYFLTPAQEKELARIAEEDKRKTFVHDHSRFRLLGAWYFTIGLCRVLQERENPLTPLDAYWLGMIDEVIGSTLPNIRKLVEGQPPAAPQDGRAPEAAGPAA